MNKENIIKWLETATEQRTRDNGEKFWCFTDKVSKDKAIMDLLFKAGFEVKDFYYDTINSAFLDIAYFLKSHDLEEIEEFDVNEYAEADIYNYDLLKWLQDDLTNIYYCDDVLKEYDLKDFIAILQYAQQRAKVEVYYIALKVVEYLKEVE